MWQSLRNVHLCGGGWNLQEEINRKMMNNVTEKIQKITLFQSYFLHSSNLTILRSNTLTLLH